MNRNFLWTLLCLLAFMFAACEKDQNLAENVPEEEVETLEPLTEISFTYKGREYYSKCENIDGEVFIVDDKVRGVLEKLGENLTLATLVREEGKYEYYDSYEEVEDLLGIKEELLSKAQGDLLVHLSRCTLWMNYDFNQKKSMPLTNPHTILTPPIRTISYPVMPYDTDNKASSLHMRAEWRYATDLPIKLNGQICYVTLFTEKNYKGHSITFSLFFPDTDLKINNLSRYSFGPPLVGDWDDKTSSFIFGIGSAIPY